MVEGGSDRDRLEGDEIDLDLTASSDAVRDFDVDLVLNVNSVTNAQVSLARIVADFESDVRNDSMVVNLEYAIRQAITHGGAVDSGLEVTPELLISAKAAYVILATERFMMEDYDDLLPTNPDKNARRKAMRKLNVLLGVFEEFEVQDSISARVFKASVVPMLEDLSEDPIEVLDEDQPLH